MITLIEIAAQCGMLFVGSWNGLGSILLGTTGLDIRMQITAWVLGASVLGVNVLIKFIPLKTFKEKIQDKFIPVLEDEEKMATDPVK